MFLLCYCLLSYEICVSCRSLLKLFTTAEIMRWTEVCSTYEAELRTGSGEAVFSSKTEDGNKRWADLKIRTVEHVRVFVIASLKC